MSVVSKAKMVLFFKGMAMGAADVIPGVSGGTVALVTGIYGRLVGAITDFDLNKLRAVIWLFRGEELARQGRQELLKIDWGFLIPLGGGIIFSILSLSKAMVALMESFPAETYAFFFGLILVSVKYPYNEMKKSPLNHVILGIFAILGFAFFSLQTGVSSLDVHNPVHVFFGGAVAICALILPGISGSTFLVLMGLYKPILKALHDRDIGTISLFMLGMAVGILSFIRVLNWCLSHHKHTTMAALAGLMLGSLKKVWPYEVTQGFETNAWVLLSCCLFGGILIYALEKAAGSFQSPTRLTKF